MSYARFLFSILCANGPYVSANMSKSRNGQVFDFQMEDLLGALMRTFRGVKTNILMACLTFRISCFSLFHEWRETVGFLWIPYQVGIFADHV